MDGKTKKGRGEKIPSWQLNFPNPLARKWGTEMGRRKRGGGTAVEPTYQRKKKGGKNIPTTWGMGEKNTRYHFCDSVSKNKPLRRRKDILIEYRLGNQKKWGDVPAVLKESEKKTGAG